MKYNKQAFSFVEIIIVVSILTFITIIGLATMNSQEEKSKNTKITSDVETINNALLAYSAENETLPMPNGNKNFFKDDGGYSHSATGAFGVYGSVTEDTIAKKYLDIVPLDPRTNSYYAYGKTLEDVDNLVKNQFEIASVQIIDTYPQAKVSGNYTAEYGPYGLIREYNGPNFVYDLSNANFPYNPDELVLLATDKDGKIYMQGDTITTGTGSKELFFSDGSVSILEPNSTLILNELSFPAKDNLNTVVKLALQAGTIWTRATKLNEESHFEVYTKDSTAAVRGTIFGVTAYNGTSDDKTEVIVLEGTVEVYPAPVSLQQEIIPADDIFIPTKELRLNNRNPGAIKEIKVEQGNEPKKIERKRSEEIDETSGNTPSLIETTYFDSIEIIENTISEQDIPVFSYNEDRDEIQEKTVLNEEVENVLLATNKFSIDNEEDDSNFCPSFEVEGECVENSLGDDWELVAYAPYNQNAGLYNKNNTTISKFFGTSSFLCGEDLSANTINTSNKNTYLCNNYRNSSNIINLDYNIYNINGTKGLFLDNINKDDYLKYNISNLALGENFAIEMSVRGGGLENSGNNFLFQTTNSNITYLKNVLQTYNNQNGKKLMGNNGQYNKIIIPTLDNNIFYKVQYICNNASETIKIVGANINETSTGSIGCNTFTDLYIGSKNDKTNQWNDIIDYVKIYRR